MPNVRLVGLSDDAPSTPVPLKGSTSGLLAELLVIVMEPLRAPVVVGVNVTCTTQVAFSAMGVPIEQVFVCEKSPDAVMAESVTGPVPGPLLVMVKLETALAMPTV